MMKKYIFLFLLLFPGVCFAQTITGVSGTVSNGQSITITGSSFGATGPTVKLFDDFDSGTANAYIGNGVTSAIIGSWEDCGASCTPTYYSIYSATQKHSGTQSARQNWANSPQPDGGAMWIGANLGGPITQIYFSFWVYLPSGQVVPGATGAYGANWKVWWLQRTGNHADDFASEVITNPPSETSLCYVDGTTNRLCYGYAPFSFTRGQWQRFEVYMTASTSSGVGQLWFTSASQARNLWANETGRTIDNGSDGWYLLRLPGYARYDTNSNTYYDDMYVATGAGARARVEIGNSSVYTSCTNLAVITPTSWSDTSIAATVRQGSFAAGPAYLFVTNSSGVTSSGRAITVGGSGGDETAPSVLITHINGSANQSATYSTSSSTVTLAGTASDAVGVVTNGVTWANNRGGSGTTTCANCDGTAGTKDWSQSGITLQSGENIITIYGSDAVPNTGTDVLTVTYETTPPTVTSASVNGSTATINFSETVVTTGYDTGDFNLDCTSPTLTNVALSSPSGSGSTRTFTIATPIVYGQTCNLDYVGSAGDITDAASPANDMVAVNDIDVTNSTPAPDTTPASFTFTDTTGATRSTQYTALVQITGIDTSITCTGSGGTVAACTGSTVGTCGTFGATSGTITNNQYVAARVTSSASYSTAVNNLVNCGGVSDTYTVTTIADPADLTPPVCIINNPTTNTTWPTSSATITVGGSATDGVGVTSISWACPTCTPASGVATCVGCTGQSVTWSQLVALTSGANVFTATATDGVNTHADAITITYTPGVGPAEHSPSDVRGVTLRGVKR